MKNLLKYVAIIGLLTAGIACENKSSNTEPQAVAPAADPSADPLASGDAAVAAQSAIAASGAAVSTSTVVAHESNVGETPAGNEGMSWDEIIATYPALADRVGFLASIDKVVETDARTFDLYSGGTIVLTLEYTAAGDALVVKNSAHAGFAADLITLESTSAEQSQGAVADRLDFIMSSCDVVKEEPVQEQEQAQTGKEAPVKEEPVKVEEEKAQEQEQAQTGKEAPVKEEPVKEEPKQECASIVASLVLEQVVEKQEQEQKEEVVKEEPKQEQEQAQEGKEAPVKEEPVKEEPKQEQEQKEPAPAQQEQK